MRSDSSSSESSDSEGSSGDHMDVLLAQRALKVASTDSLDDEADDMYTTMEGFGDNVLDLEGLSSSRLAAATTNNDDDDEDDRYGEVPVRPTTLATHQNSPALPQIPNAARGAPTGPRDSPTVPNVSPVMRMSPIDPRESPVPPGHSPVRFGQSPITPKEPPLSPTQQLPDKPRTSRDPPTALDGPPTATTSKPDSDSDDNIYQNSKTVLNDLGTNKKAVPAPAPRRANTVQERTTRSPAPRPSVRRQHKKKEDENEDTYENFLGEFGMGVSSNRGSQQQPGNVPQELSPTSNVKDRQPSLTNSSSLPLPPIPCSSKLSQTVLSKHKSNSVTSGSSVVHAPNLDVNIPMADGESCGSSLASPVASPNQPAESNLPRRYVETIHLD